MSANNEIFSSKFPLFRTFLTQTQVGRIPSDTPQNRRLFIWESVQWLMEIFENLVDNRFVIIIVDWWMLSECHLVLGTTFFVYFVELRIGETHWKKHRDFIDSWVKNYVCSFKNASKARQTFFDVSECLARLWRVFSYSKLSFSIIF